MWVGRHCFLTMSGLNTISKSLCGTRVRLVDHKELAVSQAPVAHRVQWTRQDPEEPVTRWFLLLCWILLWLVLSIAVSASIIANVTLQTILYHFLLCFNQYSVGRHILMVQEHPIKYGLSTQGIILVDLYYTNSQRIIHRIFKQFDWLKSNMLPRYRILRTIK